eukprot:scaffold155268_cov42-Tisochrysis_lutea.AAC.3
MASSYAEPLATVLLGASAAWLIYRARRRVNRPLELHLHKDGCVRRHTVSITALKQMPHPVVLDDESKGVKVSELLHSVVGLEAEGTTGIFYASDGVKSLPIPANELGEGVLIHTSRTGGPVRGGPIRLRYPPGKAVQPSPCGKETVPLSLKGVVKLCVSG